MKLVPKAPEVTPTRGVWGAAFGVFLWIGMVGLYELYHPLVFIIPIMVLVISVWLIGGELLEKHLQEKK